MIYRFGPFALDLSFGQLSRDGEEVAVEPRAFALLGYLVRHRDRLVTKDELVERIWEGRFITDAAISTLIKTARRAVDDDGKAQRLIRTVHGRGYRFAGVVEEQAPAAVLQPPLPDLPLDSALRETGHRPSIAVLPFRQVGQTETWGAIADAVPSELISSLSRLRWLKVVARGSAFRFRDETPDLEAIRTTLGASYCLTGDVEVFGSNLALTIELADTRDGRIIWGDRRTGQVDDVHLMRSEIVTLVTSAMELHISLHEAERARLRPPQALDAWSHFHLGLRHMYRFNATDNSIAADHFARAVALDRNFARAHAARSFTSFQSAFVNYGSDRDLEIANARRFAERCLELDPMEPFGNFTYGRSFWLQNDHDSGQAFLDRAIDFSPSFSHGMYAHAFVNLMCGRGELAVEKLDEAISLSPLDPFLYAMESAKGFSLAHTGDLDQACHWLDKGSRQPGAHYLVSIIAAAINEIADNREKASYWASRTLSLRPDASIEQFFVAYPLRDGGMRRAVHTALHKLGFPER